MKFARLLICTIPLLGGPLLLPTDADACGGCIVSQTETTQVTGHRMILSMSIDRTTLWDQISYVGAPESFAWVLPTKGIVDVGLSSDALFKVLDDTTRVVVNSPMIQCPPIFCNSAGFSSSASGASGGGGGVMVIAEEVVGPYETVQLSSQDPNALKNWLLANGYYLPPDIAPIVDAYVNEGFNFLALKLVPGKAIDSMRPVRVTSPGATPVLPLRMVAGGTGQTTPITLWAMGEGRYEPDNFSNFTIEASQLVWNWDTQSSNYKQIKQDAFTASLGKTWLIEDAEPFSKYGIESMLQWTAQSDPVASGYGGDPMGPTAIDECNADLEMLWGSIPQNSLWVTRMHGELSRAALVSDLTLKASLSQTTVEHILNVINTVGTRPECPQPPPGCDGNSSSSGNGGAGGNSIDLPSTSSCAMSTDSESDTIVGLLGVALALSFARKRSRRAS